MELLLLSRASDVNRYFPAESEAIAAYLTAVT